MYPQATHSPCCQTNSRAVFNWEPAINSMKILEPESSVAVADRIKELEELARYIRSDRPEPYITIPDQEPRFRNHFWREACDDVLSVDWHEVRDRACWRFCSHGLPVVILATVIFLIVQVSGPVGIGQPSLCTPSGSFSISTEAYSPWTNGSVFSIDLTYGSYTFAMAKTVDIAWDIGVGRMGQILLAAITYRAFTKALVRTMESSSVSQESFKAITLQAGSISGNLTLCKEVFRTKGLRARFSILGTVLGTFFVLLFPTWVGAMTGYTAEIRPFIGDKDGNPVPLEDFLPIIYTIQTGKKIGLPDAYPVTAPWGTTQPFLSLSTPTLGNGIYGCPPITTDIFGNIDPTNIDEGCLLMWQVSHYAFSYGFTQDFTRNSTFTHPHGVDVNISASVGTLDINPFFYSPHPFDTLCSPKNTQNWTLVPYGMNVEMLLPFGTDVDKVLESCMYRTSNPPFHHPSSNTTYGLEQILQGGTCYQTPSDVTYKWGFSYLLLYPFLWTLLIWTLLIYIIYLDSYLNSRLDVYPRHMGLERAVLDLSLVMQEELKGEDTTLFRNGTIRKFVKNTQMSYENIDLESMAPSRGTRLIKWWTAFSIRPWIRAEKWWLLSLTMFGILFILSLYLEVLARGWSPYVSVLPDIGVLFVLGLGRKVRSRWVAFATWFLLFLVGDLALSITYWSQHG